MDSQSKFLIRFNGDDFKLFRKPFDHLVDDSSIRLGKLYLDGDKLWMIVKGGRLEYLDLKTEDFHAESILQLKKNIEKLPD